MTKGQKQLDDLKMNLYFATGIKLDTDEIEKELQMTQKLEEALKIIIEKRVDTFNLKAYITVYQFNAFTSIPYNRLKEEEWDLLQEVLKWLNRQ